MGADPLSFSGVYSEMLNVHAVCVCVAFRKKGQARPEGNDPHIANVGAPESLGSPPGVLSVLFRIRHRDPQRISGIESMTGFD